MKQPMKIWTGLVGYSKKQIYQFNSRKLKTRLIEVTGYNSNLVTFDNIKTGKTEGEAWAANIRIAVINQLMQNKSVENLIYIDSDSIIRKDFGDFNGIMEDADIRIRMRDQLKERGRVSVGTIFFNNTKNTRDFTKIWLKSSRGKLKTWFTDQLQFYRTMMKMPHVKIRHLSTRYLGTSLRDNDYVWNGKSKIKFQDERYLAEYNKYRRGK